MNNWDSNPNKFTHGDNAGLGWNLTHLGTCSPLFCPFRLGDPPSLVSSKEPRQVGIPVVEGAIADIPGVALCAVVPVYEVGVEGCVKLGHLYL